MATTDITTANKVEIGSTPSEILKHIAVLNPQILSFEFSFYTPILNVAEMKQEPDTRTKMTRHYPPKVVQKLHANVIRSSDDPNFGLSVAENEIINLHSRVMTPNGYLHIPMMDLNCSISDANLQRVREYSSALGLEGVILQSGRSYHYYGFHLLSEKSWIDEFIAPSMLAEVCDIRYIAHKLKDGFITLRLTAGGLRSVLPKVVLFV